MKSIQGVIFKEHGVDPTDGQSVPAGFVELS